MQMQHVFRLLLAKPTRGLRKGTGYHWDVLVMGVLTLACSLFGLPWMCAAAAQSLEHVQSLTRYRRRAPGQHAIVESVIEQRVTSLVVALLIGLLLLPVA